MSFTTPVYTPTDGLKDTTSFPTTPASEAAARKQFQDMFDQVTTLLNALIDELESVTTGSSGAENIGSAAIESVTGTTVRAQISDLKTQIDAIIAGSVSDGAITTAKLAADAVDGTKIADDSIDSEHYVDGSIDTAHIADGAVTADKLGATSIAEANITDGAVTADKIGTGAITEGKIDTGAVTQTKIGTGAVTTSKVADGGITRAKLASDASSTITLLWTGTWSSGAQVITDSYKYNRLLVFFNGGSSIQLIRSNPTSSSGGFRGVNCGILSSAIDTLSLTIVSGDLLSFDGHKRISFSDGAYPSVADLTTSITAVYGMN